MIWIEKSLNSAMLPLLPNGFEKLTWYNVVKWMTDAFILNT
jgi:hypothetical protein